MRTPDLFGDRPKRKPPRVMMKPYDGYGSDDWGILYKCKCGHEQPGFFDKEPTHAQIHRGIPCPKCNEGNANVEEK